MASLCVFFSSRILSSYSQFCKLWKIKLIIIYSAIKLSISHYFISPVDNSQSTRVSHSTFFLNVRSILLNNCSLSEHNFLTHINGRLIVSCMENHAKKDTFLLLSFSFKKIWSLYGITYNKRGIANGFLASWEQMLRGKVKASPRGLVLRLRSQNFASLRPVGFCRYK